MKRTKQFAEKEPITRSKSKTIYSARGGIFIPGSESTSQMKSDIESSPFIEVQRSYLESVGQRVPDEKELMQEKLTIQRALDEERNRAGIQNSVVSGRNTCRIQFKKLSKTILNVVGEDHVESGGRRRKEKKIAKDEANGGYWKEHDFKEGEDLRSGLFWWAQRDNRKYGDDASLVFKHNAAHMHEIINRWEKYVMKYPTVQVSWNDIKMALRDSLRFGEQAELAFARILSPTNEDAGLKNDCKLMASLVLLICDHSYDEWKEFKETYSSLRKRINARIDGKSTGQISTLRSTSMKDSANLTSNRSGIWKVGERHIKEIGNENNFEILSQKQFNDEYFPRND